MIGYANKERTEVITTVYWTYAITGTEKNKPLKHNLFMAPTAYRP